MTALTLRLVSPETSTPQSAAWLGVTKLSGPMILRRIGTLLSSPSIDSTRIDTWQRFSGMVLTITVNPTRWSSILNSSRNLLMISNWSILEPSRPTRGGTQPLKRPSGETDFWYLFREGSAGSLDVGMILPQFEKLLHMIPKGRSATSLIVECYRSGAPRKFNCSYKFTTRS